MCSVFPFWDLQVGTHGVFILKEEGVELQFSKDLSVYSSVGSALPKSAAQLMLGKLPRICFCQSYSHAQ